MNKSSEQPTTAARLDVRRMSESQFAELGVSAVAYIKPVIVDGNVAVAIHAANGTPMGIAENHAVAAAAIQQHEMIPALVH